MRSSCYISNMGTSTVSLPANSRDGRAWFRGIRRGLLRPVRGSGQFDGVIDITNPNDRENVPKVSVRRSLISCRTRVIKVAISFRQARR